MKISVSIFLKKNTVIGHFAKNKNTKKATRFKWLYSECNKEGI